MKIMDRYEVQKIIREERDKYGPGLFGAIMFFLTLGLICYIANQAGTEFRQLKEDVKVLKEQIEKK